ncbi:MAG: 16S rRNA (adenine(1518)-N(6)/adenine(1519)-N(6))-dimethyltransferase RsmA [Bacteroides sp.]|nr:16S rRNA (adenine(1518)-N(6)/adenine(1519)-N(6))-dimethyltransferase RsmA [Ruminococcus flavefaciens]MCM1554238.1 16S rRNA (adenine(1518)-N(6)/adenine(1519)-N(6))-dimethyltransferase RsmA [Bacteroides sp.]
MKSSHTRKSRPTEVRAKKNLGQHFLNNTDMARVIARCVHAHYVPKLMPDGSLDGLEAGALSRDASEFSSLDPTSLNVLEIGPGMGVLSQCLWEDPSLNVSLVELDAESVVYLARHFPQQTDNGRLIPADFLKMDLDRLFPDTTGKPQEFVLTGNFPYNISSQILFRALDNKERIPLVSGMFQKEVGERVCAKPGSKAYGILSVLLQAFYNTEYLFTVEPFEFTPPPQVRSCVIRLTRNDTERLGCDEKRFTGIVKRAFNQRRKTLRNALQSFAEEQNLPLSALPQQLLGKRAEELSVQDYISLTQCFEK